MAAPSPSPTPRLVVLKGEIPVPEIHPVFKVWGSAFKDIEQRAKGRVKFEVHAGQALVPLREGLEATGKGMIDWFGGGPMWFAGKEPLFDITSVPFAFYDQLDAIQTFRKTELGKMLEEASNKFNVTIGGYAMVDQDVILSTKPVRRMEDLKGLKIRAAGPADLEALKRLGATPVAVAPPEIYLSMEKGIIDACVLPYYGLKAYKLEEVVKYITEIPIIPAKIAVYWFNLDKWNALPSDLQQIIRATLQEWEGKQLALWQENRKENKQAAIDKGIEIITLSEEEIERWRRVGGPPVWEWLAEKIGGGKGQKVLQIIKEHMRIE